MRKISRYPLENHYLAVKRIHRYLVHTSSLGLLYPKHVKFDIVGYSDADWIRDKVIINEPPIHVNLLDAH